MKKALALVLALLMACVLFAACGEKPAPASSGVADTGIDISEPVTLKWWLHGSNVSDDTAVLEKANAILKDKLNVTLEPIWGTWGDFDTNVVMAINGGDDVDIYFTCSWSANEYNAFAQKGAWLRLDDPEGPYGNLIEKYGSELWSILPEGLTEGAIIEGDQGRGVYAVPGYKDIATQNTWDVNVTLLEELGFTLDDVKATDYYGFGDFFAKAKEVKGGKFYPLAIEGMVLERMVTNTAIVTGDSGTCNLLSYYMDPTTIAASKYGNKILSKFETEEFKKFAEKTEEYYKAGYIDPRLAVPDQANDALVEIRNSASYLIGTQVYAYGYEAQTSKERNITVAYVPCTAVPYMDNTSVQGAMMAISTASKNPERAMMFLNLLNTDAELMTLLDFGVEGVHYNLNDAGEAVFTDERGNYTPWTNGMGNVTLLPPQEGQGANFVNDFKAYYGASKALEIMGYTFDNSSVEAELGACSNVAAQYALALCTGAGNVEKDLPEFISKLKENGIDEIVAEANSQLDAFMASK